MSRVQLALNVSDLDEAVAFYSKLFGAEPAKLRPGYANFAIADPPLKLVLMEDASRPWPRCGRRTQSPGRRGRDDRRGGGGQHGSRATRASRPKWRSRRTAASPSRTRCG